jgi:membrane-bound lytic murein transglycosylase A
LPIDSATAKTPFHRLMIAQDTGSAIVGPARADLYFGAGPEAGKVSGRLRHNMRFVMLVPRSLDPSLRAHRLPLPDPRPSAQIAKLFPQTLPARDAAKDQAAAPPVASSAVAQASTTGAAISPHVPLPEARPATAPVRPLRHLRRDRGAR